MITFLSWAIILGLSAYVAAAPDKRTMTASRGMWGAARGWANPEYAATKTAKATKAKAGKSKAGKGTHRLLLQAQFSPDGKLLATVEGMGSIVLRDAATGEPLQRIEEYKAGPYAMGVAFAPDGKTLLTGGRRRPGTEAPREVLLWKRRPAEPTAGSPPR